MIVADKRVLDTSLASGMLQIQSNLVQLYTSNLNAIAFISAVVGMLMWNGIEQTEWPENVSQPPAVKFLFYAFDVVALALCFYVFSISTVYSIWGPIMAMNGTDASSVKMAVRLLKENQFQIFLAINVMFVFVFGATTFFLWALIEPIPAAMCTFLTVSGMIVLVTVGYRTVRIFDPDITLKKIIFPQLIIEKDEHDENIAMDAAVENLQLIKATGILFVMGTLSEGCQFKERFASIENGKLSIFRSEKDYLEYNSTLMKPFRLDQYRLVSTLREVEESSVAPKGSKLSSFFGADSTLSMSSVMRKDMNLQAALTKFRFNLVPKVNSELETLRIGEFLAHNDEAFTKWTTTLRRACKAGEEILRIGAAPMQSDKMTTESAIKAADLNSIEQQRRAMATSR